MVLLRFSIIINFLFFLISCAQSNTVDTSTSRFISSNLNNSDQVFDGKILPLDAFQTKITDSLGKEIGMVECKIPEDVTVERLNIDSTIIYKLTLTNEGKSELKDFEKLGFYPRNSRGKIIFKKTIPYATDFKMSEKSVSFRTTFMSTKSVITSGGARNYSIELELNENCKFKSLN